MMMMMMKIIIFTLIMTIKLLDNQSACLCGVLAAAPLRTDCVVCSDQSCLQGALTPESLNQLMEQSLLEHLQLDTGVSPAGQFDTSTVFPCVLLRGGSETAVLSS